MVFSGYLKKRGDILPIWKSRYFELSSSELCYYEFEGGPKKGEIILTKTTKIRSFPISMMNNTFQIRDRRTGLEIYLWANSENEENAWIQALKQSIQRIKTPLIESSSRISLTSISPNKILNTIYGYCRCGAIEIEIENNSIIHGYCHCLYCQKYSSSPFLSVILYPTKYIKITKGKIILGKFNMTTNVNRYFCRQCFSYLMHEYVYFPSGSCTAVLSGTIEASLISPNSSSSPSLPPSEFLEEIFKPQLHINYQSRKMSIPDGLPKYSGTPAIWGGNDETLILEE